MSWTCRALRFWLFLINLMQMSSFSWRSSSLPCHFCSGRDCVRRANSSSRAHQWQKEAGEQPALGQGVSALCHPPPYLFLLSVAHYRRRALVFMAPLPSSPLRALLPQGLQAPAEPGWLWEENSALLQLQTQGCCLSSLQGPGERLRLPLALEAGPGRLSPSRLGSPCTVWGHTARAELQWGGLSSPPCLPRSPAWGQQPVPFPAGAGLCR